MRSPNDPCSVEACLHSFGQFAKREVSRSQPVPGYILQFVGYAARQLLKHECFNSLGKVVPHMQELMKVHDDLKSMDIHESRLLRAIQHIAEHDGSSDKLIELSFLLPGEFIYIRKATLFKQLLRLSLKQKHDNVLADKEAKDQARLEIVQGLLLQSDVDEETKLSLEFASQLLKGSITKGKQIAYMLNLSTTSSSPFQLLAAWFGAENALKASKTLARTSFKDSVYGQDKAPMTRKQAFGFSLNLCLHLLAAESGQRRSL